MSTSTNSPLSGVDANTRTPVRRRGPAPKPYADRQFTPKPPIQRIERSYPKRKKEEVLIWMTHHRVEDRWGRFQPPSLRDAEKQFQIPWPTIAKWWRSRDRIIPNRQERQYSPYWPELEKCLYSEFLEARQAHKVVTTSWFRRRALAIFERKNPGWKHLFTFSNGWWRGFLRRHNIVKRRVTKQATKKPEDYINTINRFLRFVRRSSIDRDRSDYMRVVIGSPRSRFRRRRILNLDETPIPFEYLDGATWETLGSKTVAAKSDRSGWNKRQATLILYIFADGIVRIMPTIIFHGKPTEEGGQIYEKEKHLYHPDVKVEFNDTAYNNEELFLRWIKEDLSKLTSEDDEETLLVMDAASFHRTDGIKQELRSQKVLLALIPGGCTSFLQPLDTAINRVFKQWLQEATDYYIEQLEKEKGADYQWSVSDKRVMVTHVVAAALHRLQSQPELVEKAFLNCGISVNPDGSEDHLINIKDVPSHSIDFTGWETAEDIAVVANEPVDTAYDGDEFISADDRELLVMTQYHEEVVAKLKEKLRSRGLKVSGKKAELVRRLQDYDSQLSQQQEAVQSLYVDD